MRGLKKKKIINLSLATMLTFTMLISNVSAYVNTNDEKASEKVNLALNKAAFASSEETNTFTAKKVTDGIVDREGSKSSTRQSWHGRGSSGVKESPKHDSVFSGINGAWCAKRERAVPTAWPPLTERKRHRCHELTGH